MKAVLALAPLPSDFDFSHKTVISLAPSVSYDLESRGVSFHRLDSIYPDFELRSEERLKFYRKRLAWFASLDAFLQDHIQDLKQNAIPLASMNYLKISYFIDTLTVYARAFLKLLQAFPGMTQMEFFASSGPVSSYSIFEFKPNHERMIAEAAGCVFRKRGIEFLLRDSQADYRSNQFPSKKSPSLFRRFLKIFYAFRKFDKEKRLCFSRGQQSGKRFLFLDAGVFDIDAMVRELIGAGADLFLLEDDRIVEESRFCRTRHALLAVNRNEDEFISRQFETAANLIDSSHEIVQSLNLEAGCDLSDFWVPALREFIAGDSRRIFIRAKQFSNFIRSQKIQFVCARANTSKEAVAALCAALYLCRIEAVGIQHAAFALEGEAMPFYDTVTFSRAVLRHEIMKDYFDRYRAFSPLISKCRLFVSDHYFSSISKLSRDEHKKTVSKRPTVVYVQKKFDGYVRGMNEPAYHLLGYYEFQKKVLDFLASQTDRWNVIYKIAPHQAWSEQSVLKYIHRKGYSQIDVVSRPFVEVLPQCDRVILDYPSGSFFEGLYAGKPLLCIAPDELQYQPKAKEIFGRSLKNFSSFEQAVDLIRAFLEQDPVSYLNDPSARQYQSDSLESIFAV